MRKRAIIGGVLLALGASIWTLTPIHHIRTENLPVKEERVKATQDEKKYNRQVALKIAQYGFGYNKRERACLITLWTRESRFDHLAKPRDSKGRATSTAFGIGQVLGERNRDPIVQASRALRYVQHRYQTPCRALQFHNRHHWY